jgi:ABC-2 type transport system ATP-binding protein
MSSVIEAVGLTKSFGRTRALDDLNLVAHSGEVTAILGPNGAGKTTFVRHVATLLSPDSGSLHVAGIDAVRRPADVRRLIGLAGQSAAVDPSLTGRENLRLVGRLYGLDRHTAATNAAAVLTRLGLDESADRPVRGYSGGMRRRLDLGASLVGAPRLLLLDEPTTGLDPQARNELWETIRGLVATGTDVVMTTQYLDEADQLARRIIIIDHGRVIAEGSPDELKTEAGRDVIEVHFKDRTDIDRLAFALSTLPECTTADFSIEDATRRLTIAAIDGARSVAGVLRLVDQLAIDIEGIAMRRPTLDEVFLALTRALPTDEHLKIGVPA